MNMGRSQASAGWQINSLLAATCVALAITMGFLGVQEHRHSSQIADIQSALQVRTASAGHASLQLHSAAGQVCCAKLGTHAC